MNKLVFQLVAVLVHLILVKAIYLRFFLNFFPGSVQTTSGRVENLEDELRKNSEELLKRTNSGTLTLAVIFPLCVSSTVTRFIII